MPKATLAWTSNAEMVWNGELRDNFRGEAGDIVGSPLSDEMWGDLCNEVMGYSMQLSHEHTAVSLSEQAKAVHKAVVACINLIEALEIIQRPEYGTLVSGLVTDKWEEDRGREAEAERNQKVMAADIDAWDGRWRSLLRDENEPEDEEQASVGWQFIREWKANGRIETPSVGVDLLVQLWEAQHALKLTQAEIKSGKTYKNVKGEAFQGLVGRLDEWQEKHGLGIGASKQGDHGNYGRLTNLVKAIIGEVPVLRDEGGKALAKQIRRNIASDLALAEAILDARATYRAFAKQGKLGR